MIKRLLLLTVLVTLAIGVIGAGGTYWAVTSAHPRYLAVLSQPPEALEQARHQFESRVTTLHSDLQSQGEWRTAVSDQELNGWLALKLPESFPDLLPETIRNPRISIASEEVTLAAQSELGGVDTVISVLFEPYVTKEGDLAIELRQVVAGALPVPHKEVVDRLSLATRRAKLPVRWTQNAGRTVMIVGRDLWDNDKQQRRILDNIELDEGQLYLSGHTEAVEPQPEDASIEQDGDSGSDDGSNEPADAVMAPSAAL